MTRRSQRRAGAPGYFPRPWLLCTGLFEAEVHEPQFLGDGFTHRLPLHRPMKMGGYTYPESPERFLVADMTPPSVDQMLEIVALLDDWRRRGRGILISCFSGLGRTGTVAAAYLMQTDRLSASEATAVVREAARSASFAPHSQPVETRGQEAFLKMWEKEVAR